MRAVVLRCAVARANGGGGLLWLEPMMEAVCICMCGPHIKQSCGQRCSIIRSNELYFFILKKLL
jgi:hypothetical protein